MTAPLVVFFEIVVSTDSKIMLSKRSLKFEFLLTLRRGMTTILFIQWHNFLSVSLRLVWRNMADLHARPGQVREGLHVTLYTRMTLVIKVGQRGSRATIGAYLPVTTFHGGDAIRVPAGPVVLSFYLCVKRLLLHRLPLW